MAKGNARSNRGRHPKTAALGFLATVAIAGGSLYAFRGCSDANETSTTAKQRKRAPITIEIPKFGRPEEAKRYFDAMTEGDQRSLALIDQALAEAKKTETPDPAFVEELERDRDLRTARLEAYQKARKEIEPSAPRAQ